MKIRAFIFLMVFAVTVALYNLMPDLTFVDDGLLFLAFPIFAAFSGVIVLISRMYRPDNTIGRAILLIAAGLVLWGVAETITYVQYISESEQFPSIADYLLLLAYPIFALGVYQGYASAEVKLKQLKKSIVAVLVPIALLLTAFVGYFLVYLVYDTEATALENIVMLSYGIANLILIILSLLAYMASTQYKGGKLESFWITITLGFLLFLIGDLWYAINGNTGYYPYIEYIWIAGYLVLAFGVLEDFLHLSYIQAKIISKLSQHNSHKKS
jgi:hypothetical protein